LVILRRILTNVGGCNYRDSGLVQSPIYDINKGELDLEIAPVSGRIPLVRTILRWRGQRFERPRFEWKIASQKTWLLATGPLYKYRKFLQ
jgi:hypothetical protein